MTLPFPLQPERKKRLKRTPVNITAADTISHRKVYKSKLTGQRATRTGQQATDKMYPIPQCLKMQQEQKAINLIHHYY